MLNPGLWAGAGAGPAKQTASSRQAQYENQSKTPLMQPPQLLQLLLLQLKTIV